MRNPTLVVTTIIALTLSNAAMADELMGYGAMTCRTLNGYYEKAPQLMGTIVEQWVGGFYSGLNAASNQERDIPDDALDQLKPVLKAYCAANPGEKPTGQVIKAWLALPKAKSS